MSDRRSNNGWQFGLGLIAGAALGFWLNSEQGRKVREQASEQITDYSHKAGEFTKEKATEAQDKLNTAIEKANELLQELTAVAKDTVARTSNFAGTTLEKAETSLERGLKKAKSKINRKANELETE